MVASSGSVTDLEISAALDVSADLNFDLPDPEDETVGDFDFQQRIDDAWVVCDRFDLQTEIWRGRILRAVRDKEKKGGDGRGQGFLNWLKDRELSKSQAYAWIELANSADTLLENGELSPAALNKFSKRAFVETAKSAPEVQQLVTDAAERGDRITRREVKQLSDEWLAMSSDLIPDEVKEQAASGATPPRFIAPLVKELEKLPESHQLAIKAEIATNPDVDNVKLVTSNARSLSKYLDAGAQVQVLNDSKVDLPMALEEAMRVGCLPVAADVLKQAAQLEQTMTKFYLTWKRLGNLVDRLYVDTGASTPNLRSLIACIERLSSEIVEVPLDDSGENSIRLRVMTGE
ncbi:MAG: hypothetical protein RLZZ135_1984 [Cyanobacteriota bacterium]|jgi:hypothetical protein